MIILSTKTKKGQKYFAMASTKQGYDLYDIYSTYSQDKYQAWRKCLNKCLDEDGRHFRIISHNSWGFSVAWDIKKGVRIETPYHSYLIEDFALIGGQNQYGK